MPSESNHCEQPDPQLHPLISKEPVVTDPIKEVYRQIKFMLVCGGDSRCFGARTLAGKSQALKVIACWLTVDFPRILFITLNLTNTASSSSNENLVNLAAEIPGCRQKGTAYQLRTAIKRALVEKVLRERWIKVVLLIDEGQCLTMHEIEFLKDLYNELAGANVQLATVVFAQQPHLDKRLKELLAGERQDLVRRVLGCPRAFRDLRVSDEVERTFSVIDSTPMPGAAETTWSQFFVPRAWSIHDWRLANEACNFVRAASALNTLRAAKQDDDKVIGTVAAGVLFNATRSYLVRAASDDAGANFPWPESRWTSAILDALGEQGGPDIGKDTVFHVTI